MTESVHLIGELLGHVYKYDLFKCVKMLNMSNKWLVDQPKEFRKPKMYFTYCLSFITGILYIKLVINSTTICNVSLSIT